METSFLAGLGRGCHRRRWLVLAGWLVAIVAGAGAAGPVFAGMSADYWDSDLESFAAYETLADEHADGGRVLAVLDGVDPASARTRQAVTAMATDVAAVAGVRRVEHPFTGGGGATPPGALPAPAYVSSDGRAILVEAVLDKRDDAETADTVAAVSERLREAGGSVPGATVRLGGDELMNQQVFELVAEDLFGAEAISLPISLIVLVFVFAGVVAAGLPVLAAIATATSSFAVLLVFSRFVELDANVPTIVSLLALGLSIDYGLLLVARYREELAAGAEPEDAVARTWATAGRTVAFSALIVSAALGGLLVFTRMSPLQAVGAAGIAAALMAMLASLTLTAALLRLARRRIKPSRRAPAAGDESGFFARTARAVQRRPAITAAAIGVALLAAGAPLLGAKLAFSSLDTLPRSIESVAVADTLEQRFGRDAEPGVLVIARMPAEGLAAWARRHAHDPGVTATGEAEQVSADLSVVQFSLADPAYERGAQDVVAGLRADRPAAQSWVSGPAADVTDAVDAIAAGLPWAVLVVGVAMLLLLYAMTGSVVIPVKAIVMTVVSLGATYGVLVLVFQEGWLSGPLGTAVPGALSPITMVVIFALAFGLSMDYEVFLLGRITEQARAGQETSVAVRQGLQHTGRIITSAAIIMVIVFGAFATARMGEIEQLGIGLTVAVLVDATIVRCLLVPATMTLLGRWNWWAPAPLRRLRRPVAPAGGG
jgi:RND superfamily putative drug exporter